MTNKATLAARTLPRTAEQNRALAVITSATAFAARMKKFHTPEAFIANEDAESAEPLLAAVSALADRHFGGDFDLDAVIIMDEDAPLHGETLQKIADIELAAFALGVAWGRLDGAKGDTR